MTASSELCSMLSEALVVPVTVQSLGQLNSTWHCCTPLGVTILSSPPRAVPLPGLPSFYFYATTIPALANQRVRGALIFWAGNSNVQLFINWFPPLSVGKCSAKPVTSLGFCSGTAGGRRFPGTGICGLPTQQLAVSFAVFSNASSPV